MAKSHLKRLAAPRTWAIARKDNVYIARPNPGAHKMLFGISLSTAMTDMINCAQTNREVKSILHHKEILVDGVRRKDEKFMVGLMDTISIKEIGEYYRVILSRKGKLTIVKIEQKEALIKPSRIINKTLLKKGLMQLNLIDGRNMIVKDGKYNVGDTLMLSLPKQDIKEQLKLEKGMCAYLIGGKHMGEVGMIESIEGSKIRLKSGKTAYETAKSYAFVVGREKPSITLNVQAEDNN
ncbi:30S ribosomal protein S4e [Candidatus Woesearchaeota archaeon CG10_big_fil_rev_8_21_14_0_10_44_13]|nr:MAG: 30S ribosomal protein S4e [Candidatus Woesearchaeota archaeon CG10_big_fil_rev_8_21_14_0_10_44_13]